METNIYTKLFKLKEKEVVLKKDSQAFGYKYAKLGQIQELLNPILKELKLIIIHKIRDNEVVTQIRDIEGDTFVESSIDIGIVETKRQERFIDKNGKDIETSDINTKDPQGVGSIISYHRRYNLLALLDLEQEDDDGKSGSNGAQAKDYKTADLYKLQDGDIEEWNGKIYGSMIYLDGDKKMLSKATVEYLKKHEKFTELPPKK